ncbi:MAG TPA: Wzz/FepE/Etk N-terminal domain-containing protein, partial [Ignavibacteriaceae bacterium]|nr:Wzz/FepE/Etk N-terminal domain-containing protein [Ignavibacteriaceae bacterium]
MNNEQNRIDILDILLFIAQWKKFLIFQFIGVFILSYIVIYFFITPQYDATTLIIPSKQDQVTGFGSFLKNLSGLPLGLSSFSQSSDVERYKTIIYSRTNLDRIIKQFDLLKDYNLSSMEKAEKELKENIWVEDTKDDALTIKVRANSPNKAAQMANFIVEQLNQTVIDLNIRKSRENKVFLGDRYEEIKINLKNAEDSLKHFQKSSNLFELENQSKATIEEYSKLEAELARKQIELTVMKQILGNDVPEVRNQEIAVKEFKDKIDKIKAGKENNPILIPIKSLPDKGVKYLRYLRDVKIYTTMLEYIIPLYEQAKFDEQKQIPIIQIIDYAV